MLIAIFTYFFIGFFGDSNFVQQTRDFSENQSLERKQLLNSYADKMQANQERYEKISKDVADTVTSPEATREELKTLLTQQNSEREKAIQEIFDLRFKIKEELSREEWEETYNKDS